jgi:hypothetical protein
MVKEGGDASEGHGGARFHIRVWFCVGVGNEPIGGVVGIQTFPESSTKGSKEDASMLMVKQASLFDNCIGQGGWVILLLVGDPWC